MFVRDDLQLHTVLWCLSMSPDLVGEIERSLMVALELQARTLEKILDEYAGFLTGVESNKGKVLS